MSFVSDAVSSSALVLLSMKCHRDPSREKVQLVTL